MQHTYNVVAVHTAPGWDHNQYLFLQSQILAIHQHFQKCIILCFLFCIFQGYSCRISRIWIYCECFHKVGPIICYGSTYFTSKAIACMNLLYLASQNIISMLFHHSLRCVGPSNGISHKVSSLCNQYNYHAPAVA